MDHKKLTLLICGTILLVILVQIPLGYISSMRPADTTFTQVYEKNLIKPQQNKDDVNNEIKQADVAEPGKLFQKRLPKCLIIGFAKCGTYALKAFMSLHPDIVTAKLEVGFFNTHYNKGLQWYIEQMPESYEHQITVEKTPTYITTKESLDRIYHFNASIKLIVLVRDPVTKLQSAYCHTRAHSNPKTFNVTFEQWLDDINFVSVKKINYHIYIKNAYDLFSRKQVLVLSEEDLEEDPLSVMKEVEQFLGLRPVLTKELFVFSAEKGFYCFNKSHPRYHAVAEVLNVDYETGCLSRNKGREHPDISDKIVKLIVKHVTPVNEALFNLIGKRYKWTTLADLK
ncbi:heparan sulfate glucosamine 3-O-sulfotransferase 1-like [Physella acuta]|uniref:heparan sulfate glucosamine 3-O-sulfotransferase 1-like n=1 Tax=Physella acuta TaxID=109671 RepID=UPI0027DC0CAF|nr:heparan sulfate glucosamine 3-O-sulfotransferase 1-like [Physella acuta]